MKNHKKENITLESVKKMNIFVLHLKCTINNDFTGKI